MGTLNVREEQKCGECVKASQSRGKQGCKGREGVMPDWEKQKSSQLGGVEDNKMAHVVRIRGEEMEIEVGREEEGEGKEEREQGGGDREIETERNISMGRGLL